MNDHDALNNLRKSEFLGLEIVGPRLKFNLGVCLEIAYAKYGTEKYRIAETHLIFDNRTGLKNKQAVRETTSDRAAECTAKVSNYDEGLRGTRDCDEIDKSGIRCLTGVRKRCSNFYHLHYLNLALTSSLKLSFLLQDRIKSFSIGTEATKQSPKGRGTF